MSECNKCKAKSRYCGESLLCLNIQKGESYDDIIKKINDSLCSETQGSTYSFEDNEICENGGIRIYETKDDITEIVYEGCFPCCQNFLEQYLIDAKGDITLFSGDIPAWVNILGSTYINEPEYSITESGRYKLIVEEQFPGEEDARYIIGIGLNGASPNYTTFSETNSNVTALTIVGTNFFKKTHVFVLDCQSGDEVSLWVKVLLGGINLDSDIRFTFEKM